MHGRAGQLTKRAGVRTVAVLGAAVLLCLAMAPTAAAKRTVHTVIIKAVMYAPAMLMVERDDVIVWKNEDPVPHTVTFDKAALDSGSIAPAQSWRYVARRPGDYPYHCTFHPNMHGTLHVK